MPCDSLLLDWAVKYTHEHEVVVVASAGNDNSDKVGYPAALPYVVAVAAVDNEGIKAGLSNYGSAVTIAAPVVKIYSSYRDGRFAWWIGTSQAAAFVAGEAALIKSKYPWMLVDEVVDTMVIYSTDIGFQNPGHDWRNANPLSALTSVSDSHVFRAVSTPKKLG
jgi:subtilisin family serine protease